MANRPLVIAGYCSAAASALHIVTLCWGPDGYRFFGAGEEMASLAEQGSWVPPMITLVISVILALWAAYAFAGAGLLRKLPFMRFCLVAITSVYLIRGAGGLVLALFPDSYQVQHLGMPFVLWSSSICLAIGVAHWVGVARYFHHASR